MAVARQKLLSLAFEDMETIRVLPGTFVELEALARDWTKLPPGFPFSLRVPVEYASFQVARLVSGPYIYLTGEDSFQIAIIGVQGFRVEIVPDLPPPPDEPFFSADDFVMTIPLPEDQDKLLEVALDSIYSSSPTLHRPEHLKGLEYLGMQSIFLRISHDQVASKALSRLQGGEGQVVLDALQLVLDHESTSSSRALSSHDFKRVLHLLLRLAKHSACYPGSLILPGIRREGDEPATAGHFGEIWKGQYRGKFVCVKVIKAYQKSDIKKLLKASTSLLSAFCTEAILWSHLAHDNVLPFYGIHRLEGEAGRICLISPWMENGSIGEYLLRVPTADRYSLAGGVSRGILYLHAQGIIHGDLKGANILVTQTGRALVGDFGLSFVAENEYIQASSTVAPRGTVRWQAPELFDPDTEEAKPTKLSDVYSLGCVFYEIFTGRIPFYEVLRESTVIAFIMSGRQPSKPAPDSEPFSQWGLSESLWKLCIQQSWARNPEERPKVSQFLAPGLLGLGDASHSTSEAPTAQVYAQDEFFAPAQVRELSRTPDP
ncbi:hypothetical protein D9611_004734 [Ephemerocybe angulata]|uniref:Protein kinase domain-containing protein n=1 Tax=Ephemerocybe angulata TaxID=980116 RepID=A0A8H5EWV4_9AGAR|nr:hypothetical protein D9611_004734 [Tulosesus angulatus]